MLLLDLHTVAPKERADAFHHALTDDSVPNDVVHENPSADMHARMQLWRVGGLSLFAVRSSGFEVHRTDRHVRGHRARPVVSVSLQTEGVHHSEVDGRRTLLGPDDITVFHELVPRVYGWHGDGASRSLLIDADRLGLPVRTVVTAAARLRASPLYDLTLAHLRALTRDAARLEHDPGAPAVANATTELVRALLLSAAQDSTAPAVRSAVRDTLLTRVLAYARRHLGEHDLTPERIAAAHAVSVRQLYLVLGEAGVSLEQWLIAERLEAARRMLADRRYDTLTVAAVAARCGFAGPSHFSRRFRSAYGLSPREWRAVTR
ncbi:helix-turn-helix domain-containing protein [Streptomyces sp. NPDC048290]|uniref:AraC-like ligand-binding domain-containing protein n=1 Tax=Streptomyces sp. NPDC048290 TaxID=3155811 RepID=UPI003435EEB8